MSRKEEYFLPETILGESKKIKNLLEKNVRKKVFNINRKNIALLVCDMQNYFLDPNSHAFIPSANAIIPNIHLLIEVFQKYKLPIILSKHHNNIDNAAMMDKWWKVILPENSFESEIIKDFKTKDTIIIEKQQYNAFYSTNLEEILHSKNVQQFVVCGVMTNLCCETTVRSAFCRGFEVFLPIDATATYNYSFHLATIQNLAFGFSPAILTNELIEKFEK
ncbi:MAG: cysteine hydrolase [Bacteroidales bacterium]|nr:cysteine hydrolase [Bacteroidales bacterium]